MMPSTALRAALCAMAVALTPAAAVALRAAAAEAGGGIRTVREPPFDIARACASVVGWGLREACERDLPAVAAVAHADVSGLAWARGALAEGCPPEPCGPAGGCPPEPCGPAGGCSPESCGAAGGCPPEPCGLAGLSSRAEVGILLITLRGAAVEAEAHLDVVSRAGAEVCLRVASERSCTQAGPGQRVVLRAAAAPPPGQTLIANPTVEVRAPQEGGVVQPGEATVLVRRFVYTVS